MTQLLVPFDATQVSPDQGGGGNLPIGRHKVVIRSSSIEPNSNPSSGAHLKLPLHIVEGPQAGLSGIHRLNLYHNSSAKSVEIANKQLSAICHAIGVYKVSDSKEIEERPFIVDVHYQEGQAPGTSEAAKGYTEVKKVFDVNGNEPGKQPSNSPAQPQQPVNPQYTAQANQAIASAGVGGTWQSPQQQPQQQQPAQQGWNQPQQQPATQPAWAQPK